MDGQQQCHIMLSSSRAQTENDCKIIFYLEYLTYHQNRKEEFTKIVLPKIMY